MKAFSLKLAAAAALFSSPAFAEGQQGSPLGMGVMLIVMIVMFGLLMIPQMRKQKKHRQLVESLQKGDEIITHGGILGVIVEAGEEFLTLECGENTEIKVQRHAVAQLLPKGTFRAA